MRQLIATVRFETDDRRYAWLNDEFGHWEGTFDKRVGRALYRGHVPAAPFRQDYVIGEVYMKNSVTLKKRFVLKVPEVVDRPAIGAGCCVYPAMDAIAESLLELPGVTLAVPSGAEDQLILELESAGHIETETLLKQAVDAVRALGYEVGTVLEKRSAQDGGASASVGYLP